MEHVREALIAVAWFLLAFLAVTVLMMMLGATHA